MSVRFKFDDLSDKHKKLILKELKIVEEQTFLNKDSKLDRIQFFVYKNGDIFLPLYFASRLLPCLDLNEERRSFKVQPFQLAPTTKLRPKQEVIVAEAMKAYEKHRTTFLMLHCSFGKTILSVYLSQHFSRKGMRTLVLMPLAMVRPSWIDAYKTHSNAKIYVIGKDKGPVPDDVHVIISLDQSAKKLSDEEKKSVGHLVLDECHLLATNNKVPTLLGCEVSYITCLTATDRKANGMTKMLTYLVGPNRIERIEQKKFTVHRVSHEICT